MSYQKRAPYPNRRRARRLSGSFVLCCVLTCIAVICLVCMQQALSAEDAPNAGSADRQARQAASGGIPSQSIDVSTPGQDNAATSSGPQKDKNAWNLCLVNESHPLSGDLSIQRKALTNGLEVDARIYDALNQMLRDGSAQGLRFVVCSAYRSHQKQTNLFTQQLQACKRPGVTEAAAYAQAKKSVAPPGTSEHQSGLAVDIVAQAYQMLDEGQAETPEFKWLQANCYKYGFVLRYPPEKSSITGIIYEPWHFRYVGKDHAQQIMQQGLTLEEYLGEA